jgi:hypothetical protein
MTGFSFRDARSFECRCGMRYLYERISGWRVAENGDMDIGTREFVTIRDWYRPNSEPVSRCVCGADLAAKAKEARPVR